MGEGAPPFRPGRTPPAAATRRPVDLQLRICLLHVIPSPIPSLVEAPPLDLAIAPPPFHPSRAPPSPARRRPLDLQPRIRRIHVVPSPIPPLEDAPLLVDDPEPEEPAATRQHGRRDLAATARTVPCRRSAGDAEVQVVVHRAWDQRWSTDGLVGRVAYLEAARHRRDDLGVLVLTTDGSRSSRSATVTPRSC